MVERNGMLKNCDLFERLTPEQLARVEGRSRVRKFPRGSPIYAPHDAADGVLLLLSGRVRIGNITEEGKQATLAFIEPGELFGELAILDSSHREDYADAVSDAVVMLIPADEMQRLAEEHPVVSFGITKLMGLRRRRIERRLRSLLFRTNRERLVHLLLELSEQYGRRDRDGLLLDIKLSHQELANVIGSTRETVTVTLGELQLDGLIRVSRQRIVVTNLARLAQSVGVVPPHIPGERIDPRSSQSAVSLTPSRLPSASDP